jgi:hypothetical protein
MRSFPPVLDPASTFRRHDQYWLRTEYINKNINSHDKNTFCSRRHKIRIVKDEDWGESRRSQVGLSQQPTNQHSGDLQIPSGWSVARWLSQSGLRSDYLASCSERSSLALSIASPQASLPCTPDWLGGRVHLRAHPCFHVPASSEWMNGWI